MCNLWSVDPIIMILQLLSLLDVSSIKHIGVGMSVSSLVKNLPTYWGTGKENRKTNEINLAL